MDRDTTTEGLDETLLYYYDVFSCRNSGRTCPSTCVCMCFFAFCCLPLCSTDEPQQWSSRGSWWWFVFCVFDSLFPPRLLFILLPFISKKKKKKKKKKKRVVYRLVRNQDTHTHTRERKNMNKRIEKKNPPYIHSDRLRSQRAATRCRRWMRCCIFFFFFRSLSNDFLPALQGKERQILFSKRSDDLALIFPSSIVD